MRHPARIQAAIELLEMVAYSLKEGGAAADSIVKAYFRARRYAGSKDRAAVHELLYALLRRRAEILWRCGDGAAARREMIAYLTLTEADFTIAFDGSAHAPAPLDAREQAFVESIQASIGDPLPLWVRFDCPSWLMGAFESRFGAKIAFEMAALQKRAALDIRVNLLKSGISQVKAELRGREIAFADGAFSRLGLRLAQAVDLSKEPLYLSGWVEIQDEGAQVAAALAAARPGETVVDLCAGAGGKTLALAADMANSGVIYAFDTVARRLDQLKLRAARAGAENIHTAPLPGMGDGRRKILGEHTGVADLVLLDVPCSGSGTWRRNPEARWRLTEKSLAGYQAMQQIILREGAALVKPGGRLAYITCSLLERENEAQILAFLQDHPNFKLLPYADVWRQNLAGDPPISLSRLPEVLCLTPASHGTDGFFVGLLQKI